MCMLKSRIETILFTTAKPVAIKKLSQILGASEDEISKRVEQMKEEYKSSGCGFRIVSDGKFVEFASAPENEKVATDFFKIETQGELSKAALETLAVVAYKSPVSKTDIEEIRGVNCSFSLRNLMIRGLIEKNNKNGINYYKITLDLLKKFGIEKVEDLPEYKIWNT